MRTVPQHGSTITTSVSRYASRCDGDVVSKKITSGAIAGITQAASLAPDWCICPSGLVKIPRIRGTLLRAGVPKAATRAHSNRILELMRDTGIFSGGRRNS